MDKILCDAVFEGGGMRGIGHVGAIAKLEESGYGFRRVAGSSSGAIVASLLAAGFNASELHEIMASLNFEKFKERGGRFNFGALGKIISTTRNFGIYSADLFERWFSEILARKGVRTFADVGDRLKVIASDITDSQILVLPDDLTKFGINPDAFSIATAVRMSMSIPIFYEPYELRDAEDNVHLIVDGGILSNYPVWIFDDGKSVPDIPCFGFRFQRSTPSKTRLDFTTYIKQLIHTVMDDDDIYLSKLRGDKQRTIFIPVNVGDRTVNATDFDMPLYEINAMYNNGFQAATEFLKNWNFDDWRREFSV